MNKKVLSYILIVVIDIMGLFSVYFFLVTHLVFSIIVATDFYKYIISTNESEKELSTVAKALLAFFITLMGAAVFFIPYIYFASQFD